MGIFIFFFLFFNPSPFHLGCRQKKRLKKRIAKALAKAAQEPTNNNGGGPAAGGPLAIGQ
jgi:hypothetical protein